MAYAMYTGLTCPNDVIEKISDYVQREGWTIIENCVPDLAVDGSGTFDGLKLCISTPDNSVFASFRTANGIRIFQSQKNTATAYGLGAIASTSHTNNPPSGYWYDMPEVTRVDGNQEAIGVGIPIAPTGSYTLYCNIINSPAYMLIVSVYDGTVCQHIAIGHLQKVGNWDGGIIISGSRNSYNMFTSSSFDPTTIEVESNRLFCSCEKSSTFLRIDMDNAPNRSNKVLWASAGLNTTTPEYGYTGLQMAMSIKDDEDLPGKVPNYILLQSETSRSTGKNVNTLNCITVNLNIVAYVVRDPDVLQNYSPVGYVPGTYFVSMRNLAIGQVYNISYPNSGELHQVFPFTRRYGKYGMDGFSVAQD